MSQALNLLTVTGARPLAWSLCQRWMGRQDYSGTVHWLIVDDGRQPQRLDPLPAGWTREVLRPAPLWRPGHNTQHRNLLAGLDRLGRATGPLVIIEDDDWYGPQWLSQCAATLDRAELVGQAPNAYYHVPSRSYHLFRNNRHASLCATALHGRALAAFRRACNERPKYVDLNLWRAFGGPSHLFASRQVLGIKGLPGRAGIGGHEPHGYDPDPGGDWLRDWMGEEAAVYLNLPVTPAAVPVNRIERTTPRLVRPRFARPSVSQSRSVVRA